MANAWTGRIVRQAVTGEWVPWGDWLADAYELLPGLLRSKAVDRRTQWYDVRDSVLLSLSRLELAAEVRVTSEPVAIPLEEHFPHLAGLVHVSAESDFMWVPPIPAELLTGSTRKARHAQAVFARHGLLPAEGRVPTGLYAFCGQRGGENGTAGGMLDHRRSWVTDMGEPVLTVEPYAENPAQAADALRALVEYERLPLRVDGPHPGLWSETTTLLILRHDNTAPPLPAEVDGEDDTTRRVGW